MADIKDKIRKLLSLAQSDNDHEAKAALLKAKQLMAENKIAELDIIDIEKKDVLRKHTGIQYTSYDRPWLNNLATVIADNYCCKDFISRYKGAKKREVCFVGLEDDVELCTEIFKYAVDSISQGSKLHLKGMSKEPAAMKKHILDSYANGFIAGIKEAFKQQQDESDWGLVMVTQQDVIDNISNLKHFKSKYRNYGRENEIYDSGTNDGRNFSPHTKIKENHSSSLLLS